MRRSVQYARMSKAAFAIYSRYGDWWQHSTEDKEFYRELSKHWLKRAGDYANKAAKEFANGR